MSFPDTYSTLSTETLLEAYASAPDRVRRVVDDLSSEELHRHAPERKWSIAQIVAHLVDAEIIGAVRARQTFAEPDSTFLAWDPDGWADELDYASLDRSDLLRRVELFALLRETTGAIFWRASGEEWSRSALHPERGPMTLRQVLELYADHGERHLAQILAMRSMLGKPPVIELRLPERLY